MLELYKKEKFGYYADGVLVPGGIRKGGELISPSRFISDAGGMGGPYWAKMFRSLLVPINGQVKNFLVACRTVRQVQEAGHVSIVVKGSKAGQGSGKWHNYFCEYVRMLLADSSIMFYDQFEIPAKVTVETEDTVMVAQWVRSYYTGKNPTVLIDDAFEIGKGGSPDNHGAKYYSLKGRGAQCLHETEEREFSHVVKGSTRFCPCAVCTFISSFVRGYEEYRWLRAMCTSLGHPPCFPQDISDDYQNSDLEAKAMLVKKLLRDPIVHVVSPQEQRMLGTIANENTIVPIVGNQFSLIAEHAGENPGEAFDGINERLRGKVVRYVGVTASVLGRTPVTPASDNLYYGNDGVLFCATVGQAVLAPRCSVIYVPGVRSELERLLPNYKSTGWEWRGFQEMAYQSEVYEVEKKGYYKNGVFVKLTDLAPLVMEIDDCMLMPLELSHSMNFFHVQQMVIRDNVWYIFPWKTVPGGIPIERGNTGYRVLTEKEADLRWQKEMHRVNSKVYLSSASQVSRVNGFNKKGIQGDEDDCANEERMKPPLSILTKD